MDALKRLLERLSLVRLVWITESYENEGYRTELRVVRFMGPRREPWCMNTNGGVRGRVRLLPSGKTKAKFRCTWEPYNEHSPQFYQFTVRGKINVPTAGVTACVNDSSQLPESSATSLAVTYSPYRGIAADTGYAFSRGMRGSSGRALGNA